MENEKFTFLVLKHDGHSAVEHYCNRRQADLLFDKLVREQAASPAGDTVAYYCASVGGLVNSWHA